MFKTLELGRLFFAASDIKNARQVRYKKPSQFYFIASISVIILLCTLLGSYLMGVNGYTFSGYEIKKLQTKNTVLGEENKKMSLKISEISSIVSIQAELEKSNYVAAGTPKFLESSQYSVR